MLPAPKPLNAYLNAVSAASAVPPNQAFYAIVCLVLPQMSVSMAFAMTSDKCVVTSHLRNVSKTTISMLVMGIDAHQTTHVSLLIANNPHAALSQAASIDAMGTHAPMVANAWVAIV